MTKMQLLLVLQLQHLFLSSTFGYGFQAERLASGLAFSVDTSLGSLRLSVLDSEHVQAIGRNRVVQNVFSKLTSKIRGSFTGLLLLTRLMAWQCVGRDWQARRKTQQEGRGRY